MHVPLLILGLLALVLAGTLHAIYTGQYFALEEHRLRSVRWEWLDTDPEHFEPEVRDRVRRQNVVLAFAVATTLGAVALLVAAFS